LPAPWSARVRPPSPGDELGSSWFDELVQVIDLLELAPAVLVELAVAGQDVQFLEQFDRLPGSGASLS
jgi:hypothetical protein